MTTGERIALRREELGLRQYQVAERIGVTKTTMSKYENNINVPNSDILAKLAEVLQTSADYLCGITDEPAPHGDGWVRVGSSDKWVIDMLSDLSHDNKVRLSERAKIMLEEQDASK